MQVRQKSPRETAQSSRGKKTIWQPGLHACIIALIFYASLQDLCLKASISLECGKVCILLLEKDRHWLVQLAYAVATKTHAGTIPTSQGDGINVYEGYKHNGIALSAINSGECVIVPNVSAHVGYDPRLDDLAGIQGRNCLAAPIVTEVSKSSARCVGVLFASNKMDGGFLGECG